MADNFLFEKTGLLSTITFNRPERRNCLDEAIVLEAVRGAEFWVPEVELGMPFRGYPADVLAARMGPWMAKEAIVLCRHFTAEELHAARILNRVARLSDRASRGLDPESLEPSGASAPPSPAARTIDESDCEGALASP